MDGYFWCNYQFFIQLLVFFTKSDVTCGICTVCRLMINVFLVSFYINIKHTQSPCRAENSYHALINCAYHKLAKIRYSAITFLSWKSTFRASAMKDVHVKGITYIKCKAVPVNLRIYWVIIGRLICGDKDISSVST